MTKYADYAATCRLLMLQDVVVDTDPAQTHVTVPHITDVTVKDGSVEVLAPHTHVETGKRRLVSEVGTGVIMHMQKCLSFCVCRHFSVICISL